MPKGGAPLAAAPSRIVNQARSLKGKRRVAKRAAKGKGKQGKAAPSENDAFALDLSDDGLQSPPKPSPPKAKAPAKPCRRKSAAKPVPPQAPDEAVKPAPAAAAAAKRRSGAKAAKKPSPPPLRQRSLPSRTPEAQGRLQPTQPSPSPAEPTPTPNPTRRRSSRVLVSASAPKPRAVTPAAATLVDPSPKLSSVKRSGGRSVSFSLTPVTAQPGSASARRLSDRMFTPTTPLLGHDDDDFALDLDDEPASATPAAHSTPPASPLPFTPAALNLDEDPDAVSPALSLPTSLGTPSPGGHSEDLDEPSDDDPDDTMASFVDPSPKPRRASAAKGASLGRRRSSVPKRSSVGSRRRSRHGVGAPGGATTKRKRVRAKDPEPELSWADDPWLEHLKQRFAMVDERSLVVAAAGDDM